MSETEISAMQQLRDSTRGEHDTAEHHQFQQALVRGELDRQRYASWLAQMYLIHQSLEEALRDTAGNSEIIRSVVRDYQYQIPYLLEDLEYFGIDPQQIEPTPAATRFADLVNSARQNPISLLGLHYVLEGSNNGGRYIARHVARAYDLEPRGVGLRYLDPYGDQQRQHWMAFKEDMGSIEFTAEQVAELILAAKQMYRTVAELSSDLSESA